MSPAMAPSSRSCAAAAAARCRERLLALLRQAERVAAPVGGHRLAAISCSRTRSRRSGVIVDLSRPLARLSAAGAMPGLSLMSDRTANQPGRRPGSPLCA